MISVGATPITVAHGGGVVRVSGAVEHAISCRLRLLSTQPVPIAYPSATRSCTTGRFGANVTIGRNSTYSSSTLTFELDAMNNTSSASRAFRVNVSGAIFTPSIVVTRQTRNIPQGGGKFVVDFRVKALTGSECNVKWHNDEETSKVQVV